MQMTLYARCLPDKSYQKIIIYKESLSDCEPTCDAVLSKIGFP
jgi:hypothetical protein